VCNITPNSGCADGCVKSTAYEVKGMHDIPTGICTRDWGWHASKADDATLRVRKHDVLSESPVRDGLNSGTLKPHAGFDEGGVETEHGFGH